MNKYLNVTKITFFLLILSHFAIASDEDKINTEQETTVVDFFKASVIADVVVNPSGKYIAYVKGNKIVVGNNKLKFHPFYTLKAMSVQEITWIGESNLIVEVFDRITKSISFEYFKMEFEGENIISTHMTSIYQRGYLLDPLIEEPNKILFAIYKTKKEKSYTNVFKLDLQEIIAHQVQSVKKLNRSNSKSMYWMLDSQKNLTYSLGYIEEKPTIYKKAKKKRTWSQIFQGSKDNSFIPKAISKDESKLWVLSNELTDKLALLEYNLNNMLNPKILFEHDKFDLKDIIISPEQEVIGVIFLEKGLLKYKYFSKKQGDSHQLLQNKFPNQTIHTIGANKDQSVQVIIAVSANNPGSVYKCHVKNLDCELIDSLKPWLSDVKLSETTSLQVESEEGFTIEGFLTLPSSNKKSYPLIVMPHGGPIGVSDYGYFDSHVQWLAYNNYAILQVNYRGSSGYGKKFEAAGFKQWGRGIENDIDNTLNYALKSHPQLDPKNICIFGSSYGGYSALMSIIRNPKMYKCAASFAGVSDLTLMFNKSSIKNNDELTTLLKKIVGDPDSEQAELMEYSPVYQFQKIKNPIFLAHGTKDNRVDVEHSWRLKKMLSMANKDVKWLPMDGTKHGFQNTLEVKTFYDNLIPFFDKHLKTTSK